MSNSSTTFASGTDAVFGPESPTLHQDTPDSQPASGLKRAHSAASDDSTDEADDIEECISSMADRREELRKRFKQWAEDVEQASARIRFVADNSLVNQSTRLERVLDEGKTRIDAIVGDQQRIRGQLCNFVSMLSSAQSQIFGSPSKVKAPPLAAHDSKPARPIARTIAAAAPTGRRPSKARAAALK
ncbi:hypothetical protein GGF46_001915 [Coemansia sp. RSA 552]|nr:hypothetical protein GGF46_001915 [Coemansia sp. RSA 552]